MIATSTIRANMTTSLRKEFCATMPRYGNGTSTFMKVPLGTYQIFAITPFIGQQRSIGHGSIDAQVRAPAANEILGIGSPRRPTRGELRHTAGNTWSSSDSRMLLQTRAPGGPEVNFSLFQARGVRAGMKMALPQFLGLRLMSPQGCTAPNCRSGRDDQAAKTWGGDQAWRDLL
jgi:hypothetical protein